MFRSSLAFMRDLKNNNRREWFQANRERYQAEVVSVAQRFIASFAAPLREISPYFVADPRPVGGSLFRIHRDTRFSADKTPYKTHIGIQFRHEDARSAHCPGFYFHIDEEASFAGAGMWRPERSALEHIRALISGQPEEWRQTRAQLEPLSLQGESLKRPPRGVDKAHPLLEDLKRVDFITSTPLDPELQEAEILEGATRFARQAAPLVRFLCQATGHPF